MSRFGCATNSDLNFLAESAKNKNTTRSTNNWVNVYNTWALERNFDKNLENYDAQKLDEVLCLFYAEVRKQNQEDYEPDSLRVMQSALHRYLVECGSSFNILKDINFMRSRNILEGKARNLRKEGKGKRPNASTFLTESEETLLWDVGKLGCNSAVTLVNTMWFLNTQYFGLRANQEHTTMLMENFILKCDEKGTEYIEFQEDITKTRQNGLHPNKRVTNTKMFATGEPRCPVKLWKTYVEHRPEDLRNTGRFYLAPLRNISAHNDVWYKRNPIGKNSIALIMKSLISGTDIEKKMKKLTNHSGRHTLVKKLKSAKVPESSIIKVTGHKSTAGLKSYDPADEAEFQEMSNFIGFQRAPAVPTHVSPSKNSSVQIHDSPHPSKAGPSSTATITGRYVFQNCSNVNINLNSVSQVQSRKRKYVIYDSSDNDNSSQDY